MYENATTATPIGANNPIGVFDSGIGGLSVLRHIHAQLPHEDLLYCADSAFAPYGGRPDDEIVARALAIGEFLLQRGTKALVVACNTATAAAIEALRARYPALPVVGVEPGLKPAAALSTTKTIGVLATKSTLDSEKFNLLRQQIWAATGIRFLTQACIGLADQIEKGELQSVETAALVRRYVLPLLEQGADTLVLGCTHYPFVQPLIENLARQACTRPMAIVDTGAAVTRQLERLLMRHDLLNATPDEGSVQAFTTGSKATLEAVFATLLKMRPEVIAITVKTCADRPV